MCIADGRRLPRAILLIAKLAAKYRLPYFQKYSSPELLLWQQWKPFVEVQAVTHIKMLLRAPAKLPDKLHLVRRRRHLCAFSQGEVNQRRKSPVVDPKVLLFVRDAARHELPSYKISPTMPICSAPISPSPAACTTPS